MDQSTKTALQLAEAALKTGHVPQLNELTKTLHETEQRDRRLPRGEIEEVWRLMTGLYGHKWTSAYGELVDDGNVWAACLKGITSEQIKHGLNQCAIRNLDWPPSAPQFRGMCLGIVTDDEGNDVSWQQRRQMQSVHEALGYVPKGLENISQKQRRKETAKKEIDKIREQNGW